jgi:hypothetical protein
VLGTQCIDTHLEPCGLTGKRLGAGGQGWCSASASSCSSHMYPFLSSFLPPSILLPSLSLVPLSFFLSPSFHPCSFPLPLPPSISLSPYFIPSNHIFAFPPPLSSSLSPSPSSPHMFPLTVALLVSLLPSIFLSLSVTKVLSAVWCSIYLPQGEIQYSATYPCPLPLRYHHPSRGSFDALRHMTYRS